MYVCIIISCCLLLQKVLVPALCSALHFNLLSAELCSRNHSVVPTSCHQAISARYYMYFRYSRPIPHENFIVASMH